MYSWFLRKNHLFPAIKVISTGLITSAIALELAQFYTQLPHSYTTVLLIAHLALSAHLVEGIIAAIYAPAKNQRPIQYGAYTFFVGTIGLLELWERSDC
jgi:hypothetical protein